MKTGWDKVFGELLATVDRELESSIVDRVAISKNENFIDPVHDVEVSAPLSVCSIFDCRFVCFYLQTSVPTKAPGNLALALYLALYWAA